MEGRDGKADTETVFAGVQGRRGGPAGGGGGDRDVTLGQVKTRHREQLAEGSADAVAARASAGRSCRSRASGWTAFLFLLFQADEPAQFG